MKKYRIKNRENIGYIVQERYWILFWHSLTYVDSEDTNVYLTYPVRIFKTIEKARDYVKDVKEGGEAIKKAKYIEYL